MPTRKTLALCVVARNESAFIRACIESALPVVDEAIVVDTGSVDGTADLARRAGADVIEAPWPGDLAAAHNLPLAHARADWVLSLDGDELLDPRSRHLIPEIIADPRADGFRLPIRNYSYSPEVKLRMVDDADPLTCGARCHYPTRVVRLHRRRPEYLHRGRLHQSLEPAIVEHGGIIGNAAVPIHHYGPLRFDRDKTPLYRILARRQVEDTPHDARAWFDLGMLFAGATLSGALPAFHRAHALGLRGPAAYMIGTVLLERQRPHAAARWLQRSIQENPGDESVHFDRADAWEGLAAAYEAMGHRRRAERALSRALELRPGSPVAANNLAGLLIERGRLVEAEDVLARLLQRFPGISVPWTTLGVLRLGQQSPERACRAFETAIDVNPHEPIALLNLAGAYRLAGRRADAKRAMRAASDARIPDALAVPLRRFRQMPSGGVVNLVAGLQGGLGRVVADIVRALRGRQQAVLCADSAEYAGLELASEIERHGVNVHVVCSDADVLQFVEASKPACVINHAGWSFFTNGPPRVGSERWIAMGHAGMPMPDGYDAYAVLSRFHAQFQRHLPSEKLHFIPNAVDLRRFRPRSRRSAGPVTIAALSRLDPGKFPRQLLAYLPSLKALGARVLIAGRGARRHEIEPDIRACGLDDVVQFVGVIPSSRTPAFLGNADVGLHLTEIEQETCSVAVLEMLASGLPVVSQPKGCLPEMVRHGENGFLAWEPGAIAQHLAELIRSPTLRARMGAASRRAAEPYRMGRYPAHVRSLMVRACRDPRRRAFASGSPRRPERPEDISLRGWRPARAYLICGTPGSGVDLLSEELASTGVAGFPRQFHVPFSEGRALEEQDDELQRTLERSLEQGATPNGVFGASILLSDLQRLMAFLRSRTDGVDAARSPFDLLRTLLPRLRLIRLTRRDRLSQAVYRLRAEQTLSAGLIRRTVATVADEENAWDSFLARWPEPLIEVRYQDLVTRYQRTISSVMAELETMAPDGLTLGTPRARPPIDEVAERWIARMRR